MHEFSVNLIRDRVLSPLRRRVLYRVMVAYLAVSGAALAATIGFVTSQWVGARNLRDELDEMERGFARSHPQQSGIAASAAALAAATAHRIGLLRSVDRQLAGRAQPTRLLYHLVLSLPSGITLQTFALDATERSVTFDLLVPGTKAEAESGPSELVARWNQNAALGAQIGGISYLGSQRKSNAEKTDVVWRFSARLARKES